MKATLNSLQVSNIYVFVLLNAFLSICFSLFFMFFSQIIGYESYSSENTIVNGMEPIGLLLLTVIAGPLIETYLIQFLIIELFVGVLSKYKTRTVYIIAISVSAVFFAFIHSFNYLYIIQTFAIGVVLGFCYLHIRLYYRKNVWIAFFAVFLIHSFHNLFAFFYNVVL